VASSVDIANLALSMLGKPTISALTDNSNAARIINVEYDMLRRSSLTGRAVWRFSVGRASLPALVGAPASGPYTTQYQLPSDCLRVLLAGSTWPGMDLSDYRMGPTDAGYTIEGRNILCDYGSPLALKYVRDISDTTQFDARYVHYLAAEIAYNCCERLTGSDAKLEAAIKRRDQSLRDASAADALENPPESWADDTWILSRMQ
jgi:hypothetical protein